ncbi:MAG: MFS transporter [Gammaproteobacteria bacterium]|nr:MFS transporter [Gammaproteobacteria bacterium]
MKKTNLLLSLYFCQGLPGGFLAVALPVMIRESGGSFTLVGFSALLSLPWLLKFLWAPLADRYFVLSFGRRKTWIVPAQIGMVVITLALALLVKEHDLFVIAILFLVLNLFAATQDIGVDGLAVDVLDKKELGAGNAAQISGFKLGNLFGGGVLLALAGVIGWRGDFFIMTACIALAMTFLLFTHEHSLYVPDPTRDKKPSQMADLSDAFKKLGLGFWLFLFYAKFGETFGGALVKPLLVDLGFSREQIGLMDGVIGGIATILGAIVAGLSYRRFGLQRTFASFVVLQGVFLGLFGVASAGPLNFASAALLNGIENFAGGGVGVAVFALAMSTCRRSIGATQFTLCQCLYISGAFAAAPISGITADALGPMPVMLMGSLMAISLAPIIMRTDWSNVGLQSPSFAKHQTE